MGVFRDKEVVGAKLQRRGDIVEIGISYAYKQLSADDVTVKTGPLYLDADMLGGLIQLLTEIKEDIRENSPEDGMGPVSIERDGGDIWFTRSPVGVES